MKYKPRRICFISNARLIVLRRIKAFKYGTHLKKKREKKFRRENKHYTLVFVVEHGSLTCRDCLILLVRPRRLQLEEML